MALIGTVLLWLLWGLLGLIGLVLAVLLLALLLPVQLRLRYDCSGFALRLQVLFFRMQLLPEKEKNPKKKVRNKTAFQKKGRVLSEQKKMPPKHEPAAAGPDKTVSGKQTEKGSAQPSVAQKRSAQKQPVKKQPDPRVRRILSELPSVLDMAGTFVGAVLRSLRFTALEVIVPVSGGAPDEVARKVGKANAWFYAIAAPLENALRLKWKRVRIFPDYSEEQQDQLLLACCIRGQLLPLLIAALHLLTQLKKENIL